ncbi:MAG TPA: GNAT family N-acetyltransferase, partial [Cytophagales bacterium]|nr:GNAT family N-acetyltransferase [Cytophagales bacterium]
TNGQFEVRQGDHLAYITYRERDGIFYLMHTEVPQELGGQGIGSALVEHAVDYAVAHGWEYKPYCIFAKGYLEKHPR